MTILSLEDQLQQAGGAVKLLMEMPMSTYATWQYDQVHAGERTVGVSGVAGCTYNERKTLSLAVVDDDVELGSEVTVLWGEEKGGTGKPQVERHVQTEVRAIVSRVPYSQVYNK